MPNVALQTRLAPDNLPGPADQSLQLVVTAIDDITVVIPANAVDQPVTIQPGPASRIEAISITGQVDAGTVAYKPNAGATAIGFSGSHLYTGPGMVALLGTNPTTLLFSNTGPNDATIRIVVARNA